MTRRESLLLMAGSAGRRLGQVAFTGDSAYHLAATADAPSAEPVRDLPTGIELQSEGRYFDIRFLEHRRFPNRETLVKILEAVDPVTGTVGSEGRRAICVDWSDTPAPPHPDAGVAFRPYRPAARLRRHPAKQIADGAAAVGLRRSGHVPLTGVKIHACPGMAVVGRDRPHHVRLADCAIVRHPDAGRMISCTADHINFGDTLGYLIVENCDVGWGATTVSTCTTAAPRRPVRQREIGRLGGLQECSRDSLGGQLRGEERISCNQSTIGAPALGDLTHPRGRTHPSRCGSSDSDPSFTTAYGLPWPFVAAIPSPFPFGP